MKTKHLYLTPATDIHLLTMREQLLQQSLKANFISNPGISETVGSEEGDNVIGTESRRGGDVFWDE